ncbi:MAG: glycosyltransferase [Patescibacteria group bacterium]|jgi:glycosyltransferase involved in cell wall biosynthesis
MKLAIIHDFLMTYGGAEKVTHQVHDLFPDAPIFTLRYDPEKIGHRFDDCDVRSSFIDKHSMLNRRGHTMAMPLYPMAIESFDLSEFDTVLSFSSAFAHGVITQPGTRHISYYHTPTRFLWDYHYQYLKEKGWDKGVKGAVAQRFLHNLRQWDFLAAQRGDELYANSGTVKDRVTKFYRRDSKVIYPGVEVDKYKIAEKVDDYYLTICRLTPPKRVELAIQACNELKRPLHIIGSGEDKERLQQMAGPTIKFMGFMTDEEVINQVEHCRAILWPGIDDFGLVPVEGMAAGRPVVAFDKGGATETVVHNQTGILFQDQSTAGMIDGIKQLDKIESKLNPKAIKSHAEKFSLDEFNNNIRRIVEEK